MERRAYPRYPLQLDALFTVIGVSPQPCSIRDFCRGGVFLAVAPQTRQAVSEQIGQLERETPLIIEFSAPNEQGQSQRHRVPAKIARATGTGLGVSFMKADPAALMALQHLAMRRPVETSVGAEGGSASGAPAAALRTGKGRQVIESCTKLVSDSLVPKLKTFFQQMGARLVTAAGESTSNVEQGHFFDAITVLNAQKNVVEQELPATVLEGLKHLGGFHIREKQERPEKELSELSLVDKHAFEDFLAIAEMVSQADERWKGPITELEYRFSNFVGKLIDASSNPVGPAAVCHAFGDVMEGLAVEPLAMKVVYKCFDDEVVESLGSLYQELNAVLDEAGISAQEPQRSSGQAAPQRPAEASPAGEGGVMPQYGEAEGQAQPQAGEVYPNPMPGVGVAPPAAQAVPGAMAATQASPAGMTSGDAPAAGAQVARPTFRTVAASPGLLAPDHGHELMQAAYMTAQTILGLQREIGVPTASAVGAGTGVDASAQQALPPYDVSQIVNALSALQRDERSKSSDELADLDRIGQLQAILGQRYNTDGLKRIGDGEADSLAIIAQMFDSILRDALLPDSVKKRMVKLQTALQKVALIDDSFFHQSAHPARQVLNNIARLETSFDDEATWAVVDPAIHRIVSDFDQDMEPFTDAVEKLDGLLEEQTEVYQDKLAGVVAGCEEQQAFIRSRETADTLRGKADDKDVPEEWREWLGRAKRLQPGAAVTKKVGSEQPQRLNLAWVDDQYNSFVFVDPKGEKAATLTLQELAMHLRRGSIVVLPESELSVVDRALYSMLHEMHGQIEQQANHDQLTGLINRREFEEHLASALKHAIQDHGTHVVCCVDIDMFEPINEGKGRDAGDAILKAVAGLMKEGVGDQGILARISGHQFGILFKDCSPEEGYRTVDGLRRAVERFKFDWDNEPISLAVSAGLTTLTGQIESVDAALKVAQAAVRAAQEAGGNRIKALQAKEAQATQRKGVMEWVSQLNKTLGEDRVQLRCQRIEPLRDDDMVQVQYEIFLGLKDDDGKPLPPSEFLEAAEYYNQMPTLDRWLIRSVLAWMAENTDKLKDVSGCVINLSDPTLSDGHVLDYVMEQLSESKVPPGKICFEVTETAALSTLSEAEQFIRTMKEFGCRFSLDDFGGGDKSYSYLKTLPVDFVKLNGSFVKNIGENAEDYAVVKSVNEIAHFMGKRTIAEFVETEAILNKLMEIGVDYVQGYWVEEPFYLEDLGVKPIASRFREALASATQQTAVSEMNTPEQPSPGARKKGPDDETERTIQLD